MDTCNKVSGILTHRNLIVDVKSWTQHNLLPHLCPPGRFLAHLVSFSPGDFYPNPKNVRNTIIIANTIIFIDRKPYPPSR